MAETELGARIRQLRQGRSWSLNRLSMESKVTIATIHSIETGETEIPHAHTLRAIAQALEVDPEYLMTGETPPPRLGEWPSIELAMRGRGELTDEEDIQAVKRMYDRLVELERKARERTDSAS